MEYSIKPKILGERRIIHYPQKRIIGLYVRGMKKILMRFIYWILMEEAKITVNTTCFGPYYQGKIDKQLDILKKYNEK